MIRVKPHKKDAQYAYLARPGIAWSASQTKPGMHSRLLRDEPLNQAHPQLRVSVLQQYDANGKVSEWITNRELTADQVEPAIVEARSRWRIENASFQTLKASQGPHFEHNHGHGYQHLASNFPLLMMLQLLLEQLCFRVCRWYQKALAGPTQAKKVFKAHFWDDQYATICKFIVSRWEALYEHLANPRGAGVWPNVAEHYSQTNICSKLRQNPFIQSLFFRQNTEKLADILKSAQP